MSNKYGINILIDFECMMDIDYAVYTLIKYKYNKKPGVFYSDFMKCENPKFIKTLMLTRHNLNPLTVILKPDYIDEADSLYQQIFKADYQTILSVAEPNDIFGLMETYLMSEDIADITVLCKDQSQVNIITKLDSSGKLKTLISDRKDVNLSRFDAIWIGKFVYILEFNPTQLKGKHIYTIRAKYNLEQSKQTEMHRLDVAMYVGKTNRLFLVTPYSWFQIPSVSVDDKEIEEEKHNDED